MRAGTLSRAPFNRFQVDFVSSAYIVTCFCGSTVPEDVLEVGVLIMFFSRML